jgi:hypothetical protein
MLKYPETESDNSGGVVEAMGIPRLLQLNGAPDVTVPLFRPYENMKLFNTLGLML